jgi:hypothetical protein
MPLPDEQLAALREGAKGHDSRIAELRVAISSAEEEVAMHETLAALARSDWLTVLLGEFYDDAEILVTFTRDPVGYLHQKHLALPQGLTLNGVALTEERSPRLTAYLSYGTWNVEAIWDREGGFYARPRRQRLSIGSDRPYSLTQR